MFNQLEVPRLVQSLCATKPVVQRAVCVELIQLCNTIILHDVSWRLHDVSGEALTGLLPLGVHDESGIVGYLSLLPLSSAPSLQEPVRCAIAPEDILPAVDLPVLQVTTNVPKLFEELELFSLLGFAACYNSLKIFDDVWGFAR